jgi:hypothetical protein
MADTEQELYYVSSRYLVKQYKYTTLLNYCKLKDYEI